MAGQRGRAGLIVIWDCECGLCRRFMVACRRLDWLDRLEWRCRQEEALYRRFPSLSEEMTQRSMVVLVPGREGRPLAGIGAVRQVFLHLPLLFPIALLLWLPGLSHLGEWAYYWVARNRYRLGGSCRIQG